MALPTPYYQDDYVTLYHGDGTLLIKELKDQSVDFIFTDPPYGNNNNDGDLIENLEKAMGKDKDIVDFEGNVHEIKREARPIMNDGAEAHDLLHGLLPEWHRVIVKGGCVAICCPGGGGVDPTFAKWATWINEIFEFKMAVVWDKGRGGIGWHYKRVYEFVMVAMRKGGPCRWFDDSHKVENIVRGIGRVIPSSKQHPTEKPEQLPAHFILNHTERGQTVLDPFAGSGSTLAAAKKHGRKAIGFELDERWCKLVVEHCKQDTLF